MYCVCALRALSTPPLMENAVWVKFDPCLFCAKLRGFVINLTGPGFRKKKTPRPGIAAVIIRSRRNGRRWKHYPRLILKKHTCTYFVFIDRRIFRRKIIRYSYGATPVKTSIQTSATKTTYYTATTQLRSVRSGGGQVLIHHINIEFARKHETRVRWTVRVITLPAVYTTLGYDVGG